MSPKTAALAAIGAFVLFAGTIGVGHAESVTLSASLTPSAEVPEVKSPGSGALTGTYDPSTMMMSFVVTYKGLTGPATMAHFHAPAPTGKDGPVEIPIKGSVASPIKGEVKLTEAQAKNLTDGMTYFNVHTGKNTGGEIRGQVLMVK